MFNLDEISRFSSPGVVISANLSVRMKIPLISSAQNKLFGNYEIKQMIIHSNIFQMKNKILPNVYKKTVWENSAIHHGMFGAVPDSQ